MTEREKRLRREAKQFKENLKTTTITLQGMTEDKALDYLDHKDAIIANHCFFAAFGHSMPAKYRS